MRSSASRSRESATTQITSITALGVAADLTFGIGGEVETGLALAHLGASRQQSISELMNLLLRLVQQMQSQPLGCARANARQTLELINQSSQRFGEAAQGSAADAGNVGVAEIICRSRGSQTIRPQRQNDPWIDRPLMQLLQSLSRVIVCGVLALVLGACAAGPTAGLQSYQSPDGRFAFLYPTGWTQVQVSNGPRVVFHDLIHSDETVSLMINKVNEDNELE